MRSVRVQSAIEYLATYIWAIVILGLVLLELYVIGVLNPPVQAHCILPEGFACIQAFVSTNGLIFVNLLQATGQPVNITALGCNTNYTLAHMQAPYNPPRNQVYLPIEGNTTFEFQCYGGAGAVSGPAGTVFSGYVFINYTDNSTKFPHTVFGTIVAKMSSVPSTTTFTTTSSTTSTSTTSTTSSTSTTTATTTVTSCYDNQNYVVSSPQGSVTCHDLDTVQIQATVGTLTIHDGDTVGIYSYVGTINCHDSNTFNIYTNVGSISCHDFNTFNFFNGAMASSITCGSGCSYHYS